MVGEREPEWFWPAQDGMIVPEHRILAAIAASRSRQEVFRQALPPPPARAGTAMAPAIAAAARVERVPQLVQLEVNVNGVTLNDRMGLRRLAVELDQELRAVWRTRSDS